ncbi:29950_t:CDS:2, partial [Racocetra persica]
MLRIADSADDGDRDHSHGAKICRDVISELIGPKLKLGKILDITDLVILTRLR